MNCAMKIMIYEYIENFYEVFDANRSTDEKVGLTVGMPVSV